MGSRVSFTVVAFAPMSFRKTRIFGTRGSIEGDGLTIRSFGFLSQRASVLECVDPGSRAGTEGHLRIGSSPRWRHHSDAEEGTRLSLAPLNAFRGRTQRLFPPLSRPSERTTRRW